MHISSKSYSHFTGYPPCNILYLFLCLKPFVRVRDHCYGCFVFIVLRQLWILHRRWAHFTSTTHKCSSLVQFIPREVSKAVSSLFSSTRISEEPTRKSRISTRYSILEIFETREKSFATCEWLSAYYWAVLYSKACYTISNISINISMTGIQLRSLPNNVTFL